MTKEQYWKVENAIDILSGKKMYVILNGLNEQIIGSENFKGLVEVCKKHNELFLKNK